MNWNQVLKWGLGGLFVYALVKELNSSSATNDYGNTHQFTKPIVPSLTDEEIHAIIANALENWKYPKLSLDSTPNLAQPEQIKLLPDPNTVEAQKWLKLIRHPSIVVILGGRGKGKSSLGYRLLEHLRWSGGVYVVGLPASARKLLPDYIGIAAKLEDVPPNSIVLIDEGYLSYHARRSMAATSVEMSQILNLSRQRNQTLVFVTQEARQIDKNVASSANVVVFKNLGIFQLEFDRRELNKIAANAQQAFATLSGDVRRWAYVCSPDAEFMGLVENSLPTFWSEKLSHIFAAGGEVVARPPKKAPLEVRIEEAKELKRQGLSNRQIAKQMGVRPATIKNYLEDYPYKRKR